MTEPITVPTTEIPPAPGFHDQLIKMLIEEQRVAIAVLIEIRDALGEP
jgi:hypothetical protein